jgi:hypothetical protein
MRFVFEILWSRDGSLEPLFQPAPVNLGSIEAARDLALRFASYVPVHSITIEAEDCSLFERWSWSNGAWRRDDPDRSTVANCNRLGGARRGAAAAARH